MIWKKELKIEMLMSYLGKYIICIKILYRDRANRDEDYEAQEDDDNLYQDEEEEMKQASEEEGEDLIENMEA